MRVLVTGGSGYVGSHAVRELVRGGHDVVIYDNLSTGHRFLSDGYPLIEGDIADGDRLHEALQGMDAVMHFAASAYVGESVANPRKYFHNNVESALKMMDAVLETPVRRMIFSSTCATYGTPRQLPITEDSPKDPINPYGATKLFFERVLAAYSASAGLQFVALRYFNAAGAIADGSIGELHTPETHIIPLMMKAALGSAPPLSVFGGDLETPDGSCIRDYIHVSDLGAAHVKALEYLANGGLSISMNLGTGRGVSIRELISTFERLTGRTVPHSYAPPRAGDPPVLYADASLAERVLGWKATRDLETILASAWKWQQKIESQM